jgi:hypothetical protein
MRRSINLAADAFAIISWGAVERLTTAASPGRGLAEADEIPRQTVAVTSTTNE